MGDKKLRCDSVLGLTIVMSKTHYHDFEIQLALVSRAILR